MSLRLVSLMVLTSLACWGQFTTTASRVVKGTGVPAAGACQTAGQVGKVYVRSDAQAADATFYVCAQTGAGTYAWELLKGGAGGGNATIVDCKDATGSTTAYTCPNPTPNIGTYSTGLLVAFVPQTTNTTTGPTLAVSGLVAKAIKFSAGTTVAIGSLVGGAPYLLEYDGSQFVVASTGGLAVSAYATLTDAAPIVWNIGSLAISNRIVTLDHLTATRALNVSNLVNGGFYTLVIKQDATGGALMTAGTGCTWKVGGNGGGLFVLSVPANAIDILSFTYDGTNCYANVQQNFN